jgi:hypothetical protein
VQFECCVDNDNALGWLFYWPSALAAMVLSVALMVSWEKRNERSVPLSRTRMTVAALAVGVIVVFAFELVLRVVVASP